MKKLFVPSTGIIGLASLALVPTLFAGGVVSNCTEAELRAALAGGGNVTFASGGQITLSNTLTIADNTVIDANSNTVILSGGGAVRVLQVNTNVNLEIRGLILADGYVVGSRGTDGITPTAGGDAFGAGILNQGGTLALIGCTLTNHVAVGGHGGEPLPPNFSQEAAGGNAFGGAVYSLGGTLNLTNCLLSANQAQGGSPSESTLIQAGGGNGGLAYGGAIYMLAGSINLESVTASDNAAKGGARNAGIGGKGVGGALVARNAKLVLGNTSFTANRAIGGTGAGLDSEGEGGEGLGGSLFLSDNSSVSLKLCSFLGNSTTGGAGDRLHPGGRALGGAIYNGAHLEVWNSTFSSCTTTGGVPSGTAQGGAICSTNGLILVGSTFVANRVQGAEASSWIYSYAATGDGGAVFSSGQLSATNSTITTNAAAGGWYLPLSPGGAGGKGGGVCVAGGAAMLVNVTIVGNRADGNWYRIPSAPALGGCLCSTNAVVMVHNCILANSGNGGEVWGSIVDGGYNLCSDGTAKFIAVGSRNNVNPLLGPLANNGGPTFTMALLPGSPARDAIPADYPPMDQRGVTRPQGAAADIGAFEVDDAPVVSNGFESALLSDSNASFSFPTTSGRVYAISEAADLTTTNWTSVTNLVGDGFRFHFLAPTTLGPARYYRVTERTGP